MMKNEHTPVWELKWMYEYGSPD